MSLREGVAVRNIGPVSAGWLAEVGVRTADDLRAVGVVPAFLMVRAAGHPASLNLLWALEGAALDADWRSISPVDKARLRAEVAASGG